VYTNRDAGIKISISAKTLQFAENPSGIKIAGEVPEFA
jgi:hypothetical protein